VLAVKLNESVVSAFGTPILQARLRSSETLNTELADYLRNERERSPNSGMSVRGGWQSSKDLLERDHPALNRLKKHINDAVIHTTASHFGAPIDPKKCTIRGEMWGNITSNGGFTKVHNHGNSHWSGVYYVDVESYDRSRPENGVIEFIDPRCFPTTLVHPKYSLLSAYTVRPENGMMLIFPGWLNRYVHPYWGERERISVAFNLMIRIDP
jgi:uncharacterized protein (TIGR02466 family)